jgi:hypothetical protein
VAEQALSQRAQIQHEESTMKAKIASTNHIVTMKDCDGQPFKARVWEGVTEAGIAFTAYIPVVQVKRSVDNAEFEKELSEHQPPSADTMRAIDMRFVL